MRVPKLPITRNPLAPVLSAFTEPGVPTGGARVYAPARTLAYPLTRIEGPGIPTASEYQIDGAPILRSEFAPFIAPVAGGGVIAGQLENQPLTDPYDNGAPDVQEYGAENGFSNRN